MMLMSDVGCNWAYVLEWGLWKLGVLRSAAVARREKAHTKVGIVPRPMLQPVGDMALQQCTLSRCQSATQPLSPRG